MSSEVPAVTPVVVDLVANDDNTKAKVHEALGPNALGLVAVRNVPGYEEARQNLLPHAAKLAKLPAESLLRRTRDKRPRRLDAEEWYDSGNAAAVLYGSVD